MNEPNAKELARSTREILRAVLAYKAKVLAEGLCRCGHDVEDHNDVWKWVTSCDKCPCKAWQAPEVESGNETQTKTPEG